jgi:eukaryotic-like serine/threonine-protein kinase
LHEINGRRGWFNLPYSGKGGDFKSHVCEIEFNSQLNGMRLNRGKSEIQWLDLNLPNKVEEPIDVGERFRYHAPTSTKSSVLLNNDRILTISDKCYQLDVAGERSLQVYEGMPNAECSCFDPISSSVFVGTDNGKIKILDASGNLLRTSHRWKPSGSTSLEARKITAIAMSPDGKNILTGSDQGDLGIWDAESLRYLGAILPANQKGNINLIRIVADGSMLVTHQSEHFYVKHRDKGIIRVLSIQ